MQLILKHFLNLNKKRLILILVTLLLCIFALNSVPTTLTISGSYLNITDGVYPITGEENGFTVWSGLSNTMMHYTIHWNNGRWEIKMSSSPSCQYYNPGNDNGLPPVMGWYQASGNAIPTMIVMRSQSVPTVTTASVTNITTTSATSGGNVTSDGESFVSMRGVCWSTGGNPDINSSHTDDGNGSGVFASTITGLSPNTTYHVRAYATNSVGTSYGEDRTFTTQADEPIATTNAATNVAVSSVTLNGTCVANGLPTYINFEYGTNFGYGSMIQGSPSPINGGDPIQVSANVTGLSNSTTYHYRVVATNAHGVVYGADMTFNTGTDEPTVTTNAATNVEPSSATLNGTCVANGSTTSISFEYGTYIGYGSTVAATPSLIDGSATAQVFTDITGLSSSTTYHYRLVATNAHGIVYGADMSFFTGTAPPTATTDAASAVNSTSATLNGTVNANGESATATFEYGPDTDYGATITASQNPINGTDPVQVSADATGLTSSTEYHYRVVATNEDGVVYGADMMFTTGLAEPSVTTLSASMVTPTSATFNGTVNSNGGSTVVTFEYGTDTDYGEIITASQNPIDGIDTVPVSADVVGLIPSTNYHYRVVAVNGGGTSYGLDYTFETATAEFPLNVQVTYHSSQSLVVLTWQPIDGVDQYKVYSSNNPSTGFTEDTTGVFDGASWGSISLISKKFYYVTAVY